MVRLQSILKPFAAMALCVAGASSSLASNPEPGTLANVTNNNNNATYFVQSGTRITPTSCTAGDPRWILDTSTIAGQAQMAQLLTAYALGKTVTVAGIGICKSGTTNEAVAYVAIQN